MEDPAKWLKESPTINQDFKASQKRLTTKRFLRHDGTVRQSEEFLLISPRILCLFFLQRRCPSPCFAMRSDTCVFSLRAMTVPLHPVRHFPIQPPTVALQLIVGRCTCGVAKHERIHEYSIVDASLNVFSLFCGVRSDHIGEWFILWCIPSSGEATSGKPTFELLKSCPVQASEVQSYRASSIENAAKSASVASHPIVSTRCPSPRPPALCRAAPKGERPPKGERTMGRAHRRIGALHRWRVWRLSGIVGRLIVASWVTRTWR